MEPRADDVFVWPDAWAYRKDAGPFVYVLGSPDLILCAETPEWVHFMENEA